MTYSPSYSRSATGGYHPDKAFSLVRAGTSAYLLEDEVNEMQVILREQTRDVVRTLISSGLLNQVSASVDPTRTNTLLIPPFEAILDGMKVKMCGANLGTAERLPADGEANLVELLPHRFSDSNDLLYLEVYEEEVTGGQSLFKYGVQNSDFVMSNDVIDPRVGVESSRRMQLKSVLCLQSRTTVFAPSTDSTNSPYTEIAPGLYRSGNARYAIPLFYIPRSASETGLSTPVPVYPQAGLKNEVSSNRGVGIPVHSSGTPGFIPILRFATVPNYLSGLVGNAVSWGNLLLSNTTSPWAAFTGIEPMSPWQGFNDPAQYVSLPHADMFWENVSVLCMQNTSNQAVNFRAQCRYSGDPAKSPQYDAKGSLAYKIFAADEKPSLAADFINGWTTEMPATATGLVSVSVPAGNVIVLVLRTVPLFQSKETVTHWYYNYHGINKLDPTTFANFKPHLATYRRLLTGKWE
ncbi:hypothetical protein CIG75_03170 [Tumebacillus algifaecis]|uniref:Uncharacterized protein n=1 Tax=Tumebacillus algifaecis TaxID=1214604 RepID=A0A223CY88_9BACL|nr:hypothetical protein [Tumebacillus algifaecis]ASS74083.1 hypothetical protein CIG75_03170 [Tumebacillus algifaecis]